MIYMYNKHHKWEDADQARHSGLLCVYECCGRKCSKNAVDRPPYIKANFQFGIHILPLFMLMSYRKYKWCSCMRPLATPTATNNNNQPVGPDSTGVHVAVVALWSSSGALHIHPGQINNQPQRSSLGTVFYNTVTVAVVLLGRQQKSGNGKLLYNIYLWHHLGPLIATSAQK